MNKRQNIVLKTDGLITGDGSVELLKHIIQFLVYQRNQIPVSFESFEYLVKQLLSSKSQDENFFLERARELAISTLGQLKSIFTQLDDVSRVNGRVSHAGIFFGMNIFTAKEAYLICLPKTDSPEKHKNCPSLKSAINRVILKLISDESFSKFSSSNLPLTNVHVLVKFSSHDGRAQVDGLEEIDYLQISKSCRTLMIDILNETNLRKDLPGTITCSCIESQITIFNDIETLDIKYQQFSIKDDEETAEKEEIEDDDLLGNWFQSPISIKGCKDVLSNGKKIWLK